MIDAEIGAELDLSALRTAAFGRHGASRHEVASTNDEVWAAAAAGAPHGTMCVARAQTAGRGRQARAWMSAPDTGLYVSLLLRPEVSLERMPAFSLVAALAVAETVEACGGLATQLKWPNDVWVDHRKLCGILLESRNGDLRAVVLGIGLNLAAPAGGWPAELRGRAISLRERGVVLKRSGLLGPLLERLETSYDLFTSRGLAPFLAAWQARSVLAGRTVEVESHGRRFSAVAEFVDAHGRLAVRDPDGVRHLLHAGEVHLRVESSS
jgi:BirA family biotin operon repressor/biotin-[acetyl-CoA-carboxylase] ligase